MTEEISAQWTRHDLLDVNSERIGTVEDVRFGDATGASAPITVLSTSRLSAL